jgi:hypothetical protein
LDGGIKKDFEMEIKKIYDRVSALAIFAVFAG